MSPLRDDDQLVEMLFRNGTLTVVGIVLSFSLSFITQWGANPIPWALSDLPALVLLVVGIVFQLIAMAGLLRHDSLRRSSFDRATTHFLTGAIITAVGVVSALIIDLIKLIM